MRTLVKAIPFVLAFGAVVPYGTAQVGAETPTVVARVNGEAVTRGELDRLLNDPLAESRLRQELGGESSDSAGLERLAVHELIHRRLFLQEAVRRGFTVSEKELDQALLALRGRFGDLIAFGQWMQGRGLDDRSLLGSLREQVLMAKVWEALVEEVGVSEERVQEYYQIHREDLAAGQEVRLRIIAVRSRAEAEEVLTGLRAGESFAGLARERSLGKLARKGGDTGWVRFQELPPPLREAVALLKPGDVAGPLEKADGEFLLVGLQERRSLRAADLEEARPAVERRLLAEKRQDAVQRWLEEQREASEIEVLLPPPASAGGGQSPNRGGLEQP